jgi:hypothetical protein
MILKKKLFSSVLASALIIGGIATYPSSAKAEINTIDVYSLPGWHLYGVNAEGTKQELTFNPSERPFIYNNRIYVPASVLLKQFGIAFDYNPTEKTVTFFVTSHPQPSDNTNSATQGNHDQAESAPYQQKPWSPKNPLLSPTDYQAAGSLVLNNAYSIDVLLRDYLDNHITRDKFENELDTLYQQAASAWAVLSDESRDMSGAYDMYLVTKDMFNVAHEAADSKNLDKYTKKLRAIENQAKILQAAIDEYKWHGDQQTN